MKTRFLTFMRSLSLALALPLAGCGFFGQKTEPLPEAGASHKIVCTAYSQMGKRYRSGGASPQKGFDCSGLVWWSYGQHGIKVPRTTTDQAKAGRKVPKGSARPGDLVVFRTSHSPRGLHTGIYAGDRKFIHSPSSGKTVCMDDLAGYWGKRLIAVRRIGKK